MHKPKNKKATKHSAKPRKKPDPREEPEYLQDVDWSDHDAFMSERNWRILSNVGRPAISTSTTTAQSARQTEPASSPAKPPPAELDVTRDEWQAVCRAYARGRE